MGTPPPPLTKGEEDAHVAEPQVLEGERVRRVEERHGNSGSRDVEQWHADLDDSSEPRDGACEGGREGIHKAVCRCAKAQSSHR